MTDTRISEIEQRCLKATNGPWRYRPMRELDDWGFIRADNHGPIVARSHDAGSNDDHAIQEHRRNKTDPYEPNGQFIAHARTDIPWLCSELKARDQRIAVLEEALGRASEQLSIAEAYWHQPSKPGLFLSETSVLLDDIRAALKPQEPTNG